MKPLKLFLLAFTVLFIGTSTYTVNAFGNKLNKIYQKEFSVDKGTVLVIENKFGQVSIENWDKNSISIEVEVTVEHSSRDRAERMLSAISVTLEQVGNEVRGITQIDERIMKSISSINLGSSTKEMRIDYKIRMPKNVDANLTNKYGDIFIQELTGLTKIDLKYGNLKANRIIYSSNNPLSILTLGYGNASIDEVDWMRFDIKYGNLDVEKAVAMVILSKYSKLSVSQASSMVVESKYDTYNIGNISNLVAESGYTTYRIKRLGKLLDVQTRYGDVRIDELLPRFESISFNGSYASLYVPIPENSSYEIDGEASYGGITYNTPARVNRIESNNKLSINGRVGTDEKSNAKVRVRVRYGSARLR
jgi:hypothetical protein